MATHQFIHEESGEVIEVRVPTQAPIIEHQRQEVGGKVYKRVYSAPLAAVDMTTRHGDATAADFRRVTNKRGVKVGDLWETSAEMSAERAQRMGIDPVKENYYDRYAKDNDEKHPDVKRRESLERANAKLAEWGIKVNL